MKAAYVLVALGALTAGAWTTNLQAQDRGDGPPPERRDGDGPREGGPRDGGPRQGGPREGGPREGGPREGGPREGGTREGGPREGGPREGREGGAREGGLREGGPREGGPGALPGGGAPGRGELRVPPQIQILGNYLNVVESYSKLAKDPSASGVAAVLFASDILKARGPEGAINYFNTMLPEVKDASVQRAIRMQLYNLYKDSQQPEKALEQLKQLMIGAETR